LPKSAIAPPAAGVKGAVIDDAAGARAAEGLWRHREGAVIQVEGRGDQASHIDFGAHAEQDAVGVDQINLAIGIQMPEDHAAIGVEDAVDRDRGRIGLNEIDRFLRCDIEGVPVEGEILALLLEWWSSNPIE